MNPQTRIPVPGTFNFRDVGGYATPDGFVRSGKLFRSDGLSKLGEAGKAEMTHLGVRTVIDLRDDFEAEVMPDDLAGLDVETIRLPVFEGSGASQGVAGVSLEALYEKILGQHADVVVTALREIASTGNSGVLVHCTAGKDRTGIVVALALLAVGVDRDAVVADYASTEENLAGEWLEGMIARIAAYGIADSPALRTLMGGSPREAIEGVIDLVERDHGSVREYLLASGLELSALAALETLLVDPA